MKFVSLSGVLGRGTRNVSGTDNLQENEVSEPRKLTETLRAAFRRIALLEANSPSQATEFEVDCVEGKVITLAHGFGSAVRYYPVSFVPTTAQEAVTRFSWAARAMSIGTITNAPGNNTTGGRFQLKKARAIVGIRFIWLAASGARNLVCKLWDDTSGAELRAVNFSVPAQTGVYEVYFAEPYASQPVGSNFTVSVYDLAGAVAVFNNSVTYLDNISTSAELLAVNVRLASAGNVRPIANTGGGHYAIEPILGELPGSLFGVSSQDSNNLSLTCYCTGRAVIRVEPSQYGLTQ